MGRKRHSAEGVINKLRQAEVELGKGSSIALAFKAIGGTVLRSGARQESCLAFRPRRAKKVPT